VFAQADDNGYSDCGRFDLLEGSATAVYGENHAVDEEGDIGSGGGEEGQPEPPGEKVPLETCRQIAKFNDVNLETCYPYLNNDTFYYLADSPWIDDADSLETPFSSVTQFASTVSNVMSSGCAENVIFFFCHAAFKECKQVGKEMLLPSLLCRSECDTRLEAWNKCLESLEKDAGQKLAFEDQMQALSNIAVTGAEIGYFQNRQDGGPTKMATSPDGSWSPFRLLSCDAPGGNLEAIRPEDSGIAFVLGQYPGPAYLSWSFPPGMATDFLYPEVSSVFTTSDGALHDVACFIPGETATVQASCPSPYVPNPDPKSPRSCVKPCPVPAYTDGEYTMMWSIKSVVGVVGLFLNLLLLATWAVQPSKVFKMVPFQVKACAIGGICYGLIDTVPSLVLKVMAGPFSSSSSPPPPSPTSCSALRGNLGVIIFSLSSFIILPLTLPKTTPLVLSSCGVCDSKSQIYPSLFVLHVHHKTYVVSRSHQCPFFLPAFPQVRFALQRL
jgi:hypothetical protein